MFIIKNQPPRVTGTDMANLPGIDAHSKRYADKTFDDQATTLESAIYVQTELRKWGIYAGIFINPIYPNGSEYVEVTEENAAKYSQGEFIFLVLVGVTYANVDELLQLITDESRPATERLSRICDTFGIYNGWQSWPAAQHVIELALREHFAK